MSVRVDNSFIYKYLNEQHSRDVARTRAEEIKNKRREIPILATKFAGVGFILLCLGLAIYLGNSFKKITENSFNNGPAQMYGSNNEEPVNGEDDLIDISINNDLKICGLNIDLISTDIIKKIKDSNILITVYSNKNLNKSNAYDIFSLGIDSVFVDNPTELLVEF